MLGWSEPPRYERAPHHLVWGIKGHTEGDDDDTVNFNTRVLGRKGFVSLNLIDGAKTIDASKPSVAALLAATSLQDRARATPTSTARPTRSPSTAWRRWSRAAPARRR